MKNQQIPTGYQSDQPQKRRLSLGPFLDRDDYAIEHAIQAISPKPDLGLWEDEIRSSKFRFIRRVLDIAGEPLKDEVNRPAWLTINR